MKAGVTAEPIPSLRSIDGGMAFDLRPFPIAATTTVSVRVSPAPHTGGEFAIWAGGFSEQLRTSVLIDDFLRSHPAIRSIHWFTEAEWTDPDCESKQYPY